MRFKFVSHIESAFHFRCMMRFHSGKTLLEVLVVVSILIVTLGLVLPGLQKARQAADKVYDTNNIRQIVIGLHHYAAAKNGSLPCITNPTSRFANGNEDTPPLLGILPFIDANGGKIEASSSSYRGHASYRCFFNPSDPSYEWAQKYDPLPEVTSYGYNMMAFSGKPKLETSFPDGLSNTVAIAERYARCGEMRHRDYSFGLIASNAGASSRRASFADVHYGDVIPVRTGGATNGSTLGPVFQSRPTEVNCNPDTLHAPFGDVMYVGMFDGSVKPVKQSIQPTLFWSAVTPNWGETAVLD